MRSVQASPRTAGHEGSRCVGRTTGLAATVFDALVVKGDSRPSVRLPMRRGGQGRSPDQETVTKSSSSCA